MAGLLIALITVTIGYLLWKFLSGVLRHKNFHLPPQIPGAIPLLGNVTGLDRKQPHMTLSEWGRHYGNVFRLKLFGENIIVVNSFEAIEEVLNKGNAFAGRPKIFRINYGFHYGADVIFGMFSQKWLTMKRLVVSGIREVAKHSHRVDALEMCDVFQKRCGVEFDPSHDITAVVVSALCEDILGKKLPLDHPQLQAYKHITRLFSEACSPIDGLELDLFPWLRFLGNKNFQKLKAARDALDTWVDAEMKEAMARFNKARQTCLFDIFYRAHLESDPVSEMHISLSDVRGLLVDMLISSTFTTAVAVNAFCLFMAVRPDVQQQLRSEVVGVCSRAGVPDYTQRDELPLLQASVQELLRLISHVPLSLPHYTTEDTQLQNYTVPQNTQVLLNLWSMHHDERVWTEPWTFNPHRFLLSNNNHSLCSLQCEGPCDKLTHSKLWRRVLPFSGGRRGCPGENTSRQRLFTMTGSLVTHFSIQPSSSLCQNPEIADPRNFLLGLILEPQPFKILVKPL